MSNPWEELARRNKAERLAHELFVAKITAAQVAEFGAEEWCMAASGAGVNMPSPETQRMVVEILEEKESELCQRQI